MPFIRLRKCIYKKELEFLIHKDQDPLAQRAGESKSPRGQSVSQAFELGNGNKQRSNVTVVTALRIIFHVEILSKLFVTQCMVSACHE